MAQVACPECQRQISAAASSCPGCGQHLEQAQPAGAAPSPARNWLIAAIVGAAAIMIGSLLPWVSVTTSSGTLSFIGKDGDGTLTLITGAVIGAVAGFDLYQRQANRLTGVLVSGLGAISGVLAAEVFLDISGSIGPVGPSVGIGLWLVILGSAAAIGSGFLTFSAARKEPPDAAGSPWGSVAAGVLVAVIMFFALGVGSSRSATDANRDAFSEISSTLEG